MHKTQNAAEGNCCLYQLYYDSTLFR